MQLAKEPVNCRDYKRNCGPVHIGMDISVSQDVRSGELEACMGIPSQVYGQVQAENCRAVQKIGGDSDSNVSSNTIATRRNDVSLRVGHGSLMALESLAKS